MPTTICSGPQCDAQFPHLWFSLQALFMAALKSTYTGRWSTGK